MVGVDDSSLQANSWSKSAGWLGLRVGTQQLSDIVLHSSDKLSELLQSSCHDNRSTHTALSSSNIIISAVNKLAFCACLVINSMSNGLGS